MIPEGIRHQASLGGQPHDVPTWMLEALRGVGPQNVTVQDVDYVGARVQVYNSNGLRWARVLKSKSSGTKAGAIDMPNVGDHGIVVGTDGDEKSPIWLGGVNSIETDSTLEKDAQFTTKADLVHRAYYKHETGSFTLLDRLGNFMARLMKRAATEADPAKKNLDLKVSKDGVISLTQYKPDGTALALTIDIAADGSTVIENDGHQVALISKPGSEIFRYKHKKKDVTAQVTEAGDVSLNVAGSAFAMELASGDISMNHKSGSYVAVEGDAVEAETQDGSTILLGKTQAQIALSTGQSIVFDDSGDVIELTAGNMNMDCDSVQLTSGLVQQPLMMAGFYVSWNLVRALLAAHVHPTPGGPSPSLAVLAVPEPPIPGGTVSAQMTGS